MSAVKSTLKTELLGLSPSSFGKTLKLPLETRERLVKSLEHLEELEQTHQEAKAVLELGVSLVESIEHLNKAVDDLAAGQKWIQAELEGLCEKLQSAEQSSSDDGAQYLKQLEERVEFLTKWAAAVTVWANKQSDLKNFPYKIPAAAGGSAFRASEGGK
jgi:hypothetical protein